MQVQNTIVRLFPAIDCQNIKFLLATRENKLIQTGELDGEDVCGKRGAVYVYQENIKVKHAIS